VAIGRISGALLFSDLDRQSTDLAFTTNGRPLAFMDFTNFRFGVNTNSIVDTFTVTGTANVSGIAKVFGNLVAASGVQATDVNSGAFNVIGGAGITGNLYAGNLFATNFSGNISNTGGTSTFGNIAVTDSATFGSINTANAVISGGYISALTNAYITTGSITNFSTANAVISGGYISALSNATITTANLQSLYAAELNSTSGNITTLVATNVSSGNAVISGGYISALTNAYITTSAITNLSTANAVISGGYISALSNATIGTGNVQSWYAAQLNSTNANLVTAAASNFSTGNAVISGGYITGLANAVITTANLGNIKVEDITISSLTGNIKLNPLLSNGNALVIMETTSALQVPAGNTAQQPTTAYPGALRWNTGVTSLEVYSGTSWIPLLSQINNQVITPDGTSLNYTLDYNATAEGIIVSINGTLQQPGTAYTVSGTTITFAEIPLATDIISIRFISAGTTENNVDFDNIAANIIPSANITFDLGSSSRRWRDLWLSGNTINLGSAVISSVGNSVQLPAGSTVGGANVDVTSINANIIAANLNISTTQANIGAYQTYANANIATVQANIGAYQTYANANVVAIQANLGAYQTFSNANAASQQTQIDNIVSTANANTAAYLTTYSGNIGGNLTTVSQPYITNLENLTSFGSVSGVTAQGNLTVLGNLVVQGNTFTIGSNNLTVVDSIIDLHTPLDLTPLVSDDGRDIGVRFHYYKGADDHAFLGWENEHQTLIYLQRSDEVDSNITGTFGNVQFGSLLLSNTTPSSSTTTGALVVRGGVGVAGSLFINNTGDVSANLGAFQTYANTKIGTNTNSNLVVVATTASTSTTTGALVVAGGAGLAGAIYAGSIQATPIGSSSASTGAFTTLSASSTLESTGITLLGSVGSNVVVRSTTASSSTTTGALVVRGGVGVSGSLFSGSALSSQSARLRDTGGFTIQNRITYTVTQTNANTTTDFDITSLLSGSPLSPATVTVNLIGVYIGDPGVPNTNARIHKRWQSMLSYNSSTGFYTIEGETLIGTAYNSDGTNFAAGAVNARNFLTGSGTSTINLRVTNRTTPAASSATYWNAIIEIQWW
jgi:hypothetical protein